MDLYIISAFIIYIAILLGFGVHFYLKTKNATEFMVGDRSLNYWVTAIGAQASDMGSWLFFGYPAAVYANGITEMWTAIGLVICMFLNWQFVAPRLRTKSGELKNLTLTSFFSSQVSDQQGAIKQVSALICTLFFIFYIASGLVGIGRIFENAFQISYHTAVLLGLGVTGVYTLLGGFSAVAWSNLFQGIFLLIMIVSLPVYTFFSLPLSVQSIIEMMQQANVSTSLISKPTDIFWSLLLALSWGLGYFGQPHILVYFMGIDDPKNIKYAKYVGICWQILVLLAATATGIMSIALFYGKSSFIVENLFIILAQTIFHPLLVGLTLCAIFAAILTTMNSHILIVGSVIANDIWKQYVPTISSAQLMFLSRLASLLISLSALMIAWNNSNSIYNLVNYAWSGLGASFGPLVIACLYGRRPSSSVALIGMIGGALVSAVWPWIDTTLFPLIPGFVIHSVILLLGNILKK